MKLPSKVNFDVCSYCNHKCTFCSNPDKRTLKEKVSLQDFETVMDNVTKYLQIKELGLSAKGEVLLNSDLQEIVKLAKNKYNINYIYISTNGALLTKEKSIELLDAQLDSIKFSINGYDQISYRETHLKDDFEKVITNFNALLELKKLKYPNTKILISSIIDTPKDTIIAHFKELFKENFDLINDIFKYDISFTPKFDSFAMNEKKLKPCPLVLNEIYIDADCRLGLCCKDYFKEFDYGSLLNNDFKELYFSEPMVQMRDMHLKKSFPDNHTCKKCLLFDSLFED